MGKVLVKRDVDKTSVARGMAFAGLGGVCWGFSGACAQLLTDVYHLSIPWVICVRLLFGALFFLGIADLRTPERFKQVPKDRKLLGYLFAYAALGILMPQVCYLSTISYTNAGIATVMERTGLLVVLAYTCIKLHRGPKLKEIIGIALALVGVFLIATDGNIGQLAIPWEGLAFGLALALSLLFYTVLPGKPLAAWGNFVTTGLGMLIAGIIAWIVVQPWTVPVDYSPDMVFYLVLMILAGTIMSYGFFMEGIKQAGSMRAGLMGCTEPVSAVLFSALWLGSVFTPPAIAGIVLIIAMMFLVRGSGE